MEEQIIECWESHSLPITIHWLNVKIRLWYPWKQIPQECLRIKEKTNSTPSLSSSLTRLHRSLIRATHHYH